MSECGRESSVDSREGYGVREAGTQPRRVNLQNAVQDRVKQYILDNGYGPGDPLPSESEFARRLEVSRPSLREAMRVLQSMGIVESRPGSGTYVGSFNMESLLEGMSFSIQTSSGTDTLHAMREILEVRSVLELHLIRQVALSIPENHLGELTRIVQRMRERAESGLSFTAEDLAFHETVYLSLGNSFIVQLVRTFWQLFAEVEDNLRNIGGELTTIAEMHQDIVTALQQRDPDAAERAMIRHLDGIQERVSNVNRT